MPNWIMTSYTVTGEKAQINRLENILHELEAMPKPFVENGFGNLWCGCVVKVLGGKPLGEGAVYCRGQIVSRKRVSPERLDMEVESAWNELNEFRALLVKELPGIKVHFVSDDLTTNDPDHLYFEENTYRLEMPEDTLYADDLDPIIEVLEKELGAETLMTEEDIEHFLADNEDYTFDKFEIIKDDEKD